MMKMNLTKCLEIKRFLLLILTLWFMPTGFGIQILYPQETLQTYSGTYDSAVLSSLATSFTTSMQYTMSAWVNSAAIQPHWVNLFKLSIDDNGYDERLLVAQVNSSAAFVYTIGTPTIQYYDWNPWENLTCNQMFPTGQWIFLALGTDSTMNTQYGFRYYPQSTSQLTVVFKTRTLNCASYNATPSSTAYWGGDTNNAGYGETLQYVRIYLDYVPTSQDQMINLAIMLPGGTLYYFLLTTDYEDVQNSTIPIQYYQNLTQGSNNTSINPTYPATFGPYNMIMCRPGALLSFTSSAITSSRMVVAFDIEIHSPATNPQNLFSIRDSGNNYVSLTTYYDPTDSLIKVNLQNPTWNIACTSSIAINLDNWNRVVVELELSNPNSVGGNFISGRISINQTIPSRIYFGKSGVHPLVEDQSHMTIDICNTMVSGGSTLNSSFHANYDMMNFVWYDGDESLFRNFSDPTCFLSGFLSPNQSACLICNSGYYLSGRVCLSSCSANEFLHSNTSSCQSCYYPSRYYTNTGYCLPCTLAGQSISGYSCIICDNSCASCSGASSTECTSCYSGDYLLSSNSSCVTCNVNGYYISGSQCKQCDNTCLNCNGSLATNCLTCPSGTYLFSANSSCVACNTNGYYISGSQCKQCDTSCQNCSGPLATNCLTCPSEAYLVSANNSCVVCNVNGYYISGSQCKQCDNTCLTCNGSLATNCLTCPSGTYLFSANSSCVACNVNGYYISGSQCKQCDNTCLTCNGSLAANCLTCPSGTYFFSANNSCVACNVNGYYISGSHCLECDSSCLTCNGTAPTNCLSCPNAAYYLSSNQSCVVSDAVTVQAAEAEAVGTTSQVVFISATASAVIIFLHSKGNSAVLMRMLQIMARITFMKLIDINYLTPLAKFYKYTDLGQFGLPNVFNKITDSTSTNNNRILAQSTSSDNDSSSDLFLLDVQGNIIFNSNFNYSYSQVFLDNYGGIVFSSFIIAVVYLILKIVSKCFKNENSKIKQFLIKITQSFERSLIMTILVSRYMYLCSSLIFNYVFHPLNGIYEQASFGFAIFYTIFLIYIFGLAICTGFYQSRESKAKLKPVRPMLNILTVLLQDYRSRRFIGRVFTFWILLSDLIIVLVLLLLSKWPIVQLSILIIINLTTIIFSLPNSVFKKTASKILTIGTEVGFIIVSTLFLVMYFLENLGTQIAYNFQLILSWSAVGVNISIILFQIIIKVIEFFRLRSEKKREEQEEKKRQEQQQKTTQNLNQLENPSRPIDRSGNFNDPHNSQLIRMPDVDEMVSAARRPKKHEDVMVNRSKSRTRRTISIDDANNSQQVQLQNSHKRELSFEQPKKYEGNILHMNKNRRTNRPKHK